MAEDLIMNTRIFTENIRKLKARAEMLRQILLEYNINYYHDRGNQFQTDCVSLKELKVAAVMDPFTVGNFKSECQLFEITSTNWKEEMENCQPDLFFLESTWHGKNNSWFKKVCNGSKELFDLTAYCHNKGIPVIFWNKEDPVHTDIFMAAASCADFVFTTDFDCIEKYRCTLQHDNIYLLPFAAQPSVHNPIEIHNRKDKFCFAGTYYHKYKDRSKVFDDFAAVFQKTKGLEIYDRNYGSNDLQFAFPVRYNKMIMGNLKPEDIHIAYKGYNYGINMCTVSQSQSMFARRGIELLASNTVSVGNYSRGIKNLLGDLSISTNDAATMQAQLEKYCSTTENYRKYRLAGLRAILKDHLCEDRLGYIVSLVFGRELINTLPDITVVAYAETQEEKTKIQYYFDRQTYNKKTLVFVNENESKPETGFVAAFSVEDYYGENYLLDLALSVRYSDLDGFCKANYYRKYLNGKIIIKTTDRTYKTVTTMFSTRAMIKAEKINDIISFAKGIQVRGKFLSIDEFNYCRFCTDDTCPTADDMYISDTGIPLAVMHQAVEDVKKMAQDSDTQFVSVLDMQNTGINTEKLIKKGFFASKYFIESNMPCNQTSTVEFRCDYNIADFNESEFIYILCNSTGDLKTVCRCTFYDEAKIALNTVEFNFNKYVAAKIPENASTFRISLAVTGKGRQDISGIKISSDMNKGTATPFLLRSDTLIVTENYPSYKNLYGYMHVHKRNMLYKENGLVPDVFCINKDSEFAYSEFENINILHGDTDKLINALKTGQIKTVCVHVLTPYIWNVLKDYLDSINLIVWLHGKEVQPWHRYSFDYKTEEELKKAKAASDERQVFWREVFEHPSDNIHFVTVSEYFKDEIEQDNNIDLSKNCSVIHNCIDSDMFVFKEKDPDQRFNIMSIKSFNSNKYANDITQQAILKLSKYPEFSNMTFDLYGDGKDFNKDTALIKDFPNVRLHKQFVEQSRVSRIHKTRGIYIATTRWDAQGISRDEAMSSGLVPIATNVAAIPEFVDDTCGVLVPDENPQAVADAILKLVRNPELFVQMSKNAAEHVRSITSKELTIKKELNLIEKRKKS